MGWERKRNFIDSLFPFVMTKPLADSTIVLLATLCCSVAVVVSLMSLARPLLRAQDLRSKVLSILGAVVGGLAAWAWWNHARGAVLVLVRLVHGKGLNLIGLHTVSACCGSRAG
jgi:hypothetical protein